MTIRRFAFPALLAVMLMAFAVPSYANDILTGTGTINCSSYSLTFTFAGLVPMTAYTIDYTITLTPTAGSPVTITDTYGFTAAQSTPNQITFTKPIPTAIATTLVGPYTLSGTATLESNPNQTPIPIISFGGATLTCPTLGADGRFTGGGKQVDVAGVTITKGLELDCDFAADMAGSDNLEINFNGNRFHMETFLFASCELEGKAPNPPTAPINEMNGVGTGRYDGTDGYTVLFTLEDHGEPGTNDMACFRIYSPGNAPADGYLTGTPTCETETTHGDILDFPLTLLTHGNLQAHVDQH
jgi:hypothetical protein